MLPDDATPDADKVKKVLLHWSMRRAGPRIEHRMQLLLMFALDNLEPIYWGTRKIPERWPSIEKGGSGGGVMKRCVFWRIRSSPTDHVMLRGLLGLVGDTEMILRTLLRNYDPAELKPAIETLHRSLAIFRDVRNFYAHLDEPLHDPEAHGVGGPLVTEFGLEYQAGGEGNFHLVLYDNCLHFTHRQTAKKVNVGKRAFSPIFAAARELYAVMLAHCTGKVDVPPPEEIYPDP